MRGPMVQPAPIAFGMPPTLEDVIRVVNTNSERVRQLYTDNATLTIEGMPALRASLAAERPRRLRLRAQFIGVGQVLDLGSNDELFWALIDAPQFATGAPRAVYYARHDQFRRSHVSALLPIEPEWLIDAIGMMRFDPQHLHEGPYTRGPGRLEIRTRLPSPDGEVTRVVVVDATYGWILEQHLYDSQGQLFASAFTSEHRYYPSAGVSLPHHVEIRLPPPNPAIRLEVASYRINQLYADPNQLWAMPTYTGYRFVNLGDPALGAASPVPDAASLPSGSMPSPAAAPGYPAAGFRPRYRGYGPRG